MCRMDDLLASKLDNFCPCHCLKHWRIWGKKKKGSFLLIGSFKHEVFFFFFLSPWKHMLRKISQEQISASSYLCKRRLLGCLELSLSWQCLHICLGPPVLYSWSCFSSHIGNISTEITLWEYFKIKKKKKKNSDFSLESKMLEATKA